MIRLGVVQKWSTADKVGIELNDAFFLTLEVIQSVGSLRKAAQQLEVSYRHLWGLILRWGDSIGTPLVRLERGRGAQLTPFGEKLLWANKRIGARLAPVLDGIASELELELRSLASPNDSVLRIHASHGFAVELLRETLVAKTLPHEMKYMGSHAALESLSRNECDVAGFHVPEGELQKVALPHFAKWLAQPGHALVELAYRRQGLITAVGNPKKIRHVDDLVKLGVRFVNRQDGSGTRLVFDMLLAKAGIEPARISGYDTVEFTHSAVAAFVASGMADVGFGIETGARRFGLHFIPELEERYFFLCRRESLALTRVAAMLETLRDEKFQQQVNRLPGYRTVNCGRIESISKVFPRIDKARATK